jgi:hypothetical protein
MSEAADRAGYTCLLYGHWWLRHQDSLIRYCKICGCRQLWTLAKWEPVAGIGDAGSPDDTIKCAK